jgi:hypothetical protein
MRPIIKQLETQLEHTPESPERVDLLHALAWQLWGNDSERAEGLAEEEKALADKIYYPRGRAFAQYHEGIPRGLLKHDIEKGCPVFQMPWNGLMPMTNFLDRPK